MVFVNPQIALQAKQEGLIIECIYHKERLGTCRQGDYGPTANKRYDSGHGLGYREGTQLAHSAPRRIAQQSIWRVI